MVEPSAPPPSRLAILLFWKRAWKRAHWLCSRLVHVTACRALHNRDMDDCNASHRPLARNLAASTSDMSHLRCHRIAASLPRSNHTDALQAAAHLRSLAPLLHRRGSLPGHVSRTNPRRALQNPNLSLRLSMVTRSLAVASHVAFASDSGQPPLSLRQEMLRPCQPVLALHHLPKCTP